MAGLDYHLVAWRLHRSFSLKTALFSTKGNARLPHLRVARSLNWHREVVQEYLRRL